MVHPADLHLGSRPDVYLIAFVYSDGVQDIIEDTLAKNRPTFRQGLQ